MSQPANNRSLQIWSIILVFSAITCVIAWQERFARLKIIEKQQAYIVAAEGFRIMHHDAFVPVTAKNLVWVDNGHDDFTLEADGSERVGTILKPKRWTVTLHKDGDKWSMVRSSWK